MKFLFPIIFVACTAQTGCTDDTSLEQTITTDATVQGTPANVYSKGYNEMCEREPESKLCPQDD